MPGTAAGRTPGMVGRERCGGLVSKANETSVSCAHRKAARGERTGRRTAVEQTSVSVHIPRGDALWRRVYDRETFEEINEVANPRELRARRTSDGETVSCPRSAVQEPTDELAGRSGGNERRPTQNRRRVDGSSATINQSDTSSNRHNPGRRRERRRRLGEPRRTLSPSLGTTKEQCAATRESQAPEGFRAG